MFAVFASGGKTEGGKKVVFFLFIILRPAGLRRVYNFELDLFCRNLMHFSGWIRQASLEVPNKGGEKTGCYAWYREKFTHLLLLVLHNDIYRLDEGVVESGMWLSPTLGHWQKILPQNSQGVS